MRFQPVRIPGAGLAALALAAIAPWAGGCGRGATGDAGPVAEVWFVDVTDELGVDFTYDPQAAGALHMPEIMGSGVGLFDYDGDGDLDLYLTQANGELPQAVTASGGPRNRLFRQEGDGRFTDVTEASGLGDRGYGMGLAVGDYDNDGHVDVFVTNYGPDRLYRNRGDGTFEDVTGPAGAHVEGWSSSSTFCDYDRDGDLDLYVTRYVRYDPGKRCTSPAGEPEYCGPKEFPPLSDVLLRNEGNGTFRDVSEAIGIASTRAAGLGVVCTDLDGDGGPEFYVANDAYANQLWVRDGATGRLRDEALFRGVALNQQGQAEAGMGVIAADLDGDRSLDLFVTHLDVETNTLYRNLGGGGGFVDESGKSGLGRSSMPFTGFGVVALDADLDGDLDLAVANGRVTRGRRRTSSLPAPWNLYAEPNLFYVNDGAGRFGLLDGPASAFAAPVEISRGLASGDLDADGDLDLVVTNILGRTRIYRNDAPRRGSWLGVVPVDPAVGRVAVGAQVSVVAGGRRIVRGVDRGCSYQSSSQALAHFGLGPAGVIDAIEVRWPDGVSERFPGPPVDRVVELRRGEGAS